MADPRRQKETAPKLLRREMKFLRGFLEPIISYQ